MIISQFIYQLAITFILYSSGGKILNYNLSTPDEKIELDTVVFNTFVWMQIFNEFKNRRLDNKFKIFEGVHRNLFFIGINCLMVGLQAGIIFVGSRAFQISPGEWAISIVATSLCLPWAIVVRLFPDPRFAATVSIVPKPFMALCSTIAEAWSSLTAMFKSVDKTEDDMEAVSPLMVVVSADFGSGTLEKGKM
ncbi:Calcium-transporting ATPase 2 [Colletotrichum orbiculare MAFF 240422]|uniref:Calcium-transporting ATPase 2 n=1 Tax=Colletotrichum orbiculare (strain 104-T / ATCC 96160 / CBS 514.97 / LARS 414 / MAFF 240422) TaxID=1213857 RepID=N4V6R9_COLOR|nr:Calcium-transporting ATPase 2 [Colletotrichum orbiculare MAFF 240422]